MRNIACAFLTTTMGLAYPVPAQPGGGAGTGDVGAGIGVDAGSNSGAMQAAIPIELPPGRAGMTPSVSLQYSSEGAYGAVGVGWRVSGESIARRTRFGCPKGDSSDKFELNGEELVNVGGVYHTQHESFRRIRFDTSQDRWTVEEPSGIVKTFGKESAAREEGSGEFSIRWHLSETRDRFGNLIQYFYISMSRTVETSLEFRRFVTQHTRLCTRLRITV